MIGDEILEIAVIVMLALLFALNEWIHRERDIRRDRLISELTSKIKARDLGEYVDQTRPIPVYPPSIKDDADLYEREIEKNKR